MSKYCFLVLLTLLSVIIYLPVVQAGFFIFDDLSLVEYLRSNPPDYDELWARATGRYLRPVLIASFLVDLHAWKLDPPLMHLGNILLHTLNVLLVYAIAKSSRTEFDGNDSDFPLLAAALFAVHPVNSEAVSWISGRTDTLAAFFVLVATLLLIKGLQQQRILLLCAGATMSLMGALAKEVGFFFFPGAILYLMISRKEALFFRFKMSVPFILGALAYLAMRRIAFSGEDLGFGKIVDTPHKQVWFDQAVNGLTAFGFYLKKLFVPTPLTFAIDEITGTYVYLGIATIIMIPILIWFTKRGSLFVYLLSAFIVPAIINAIYRIAWTPYAERYLYIPAIFFVLLLVVFHPTSFHFRTAQRLFLIALFCYFSTATLQRSLLWADQDKFLEYSAKQNPTNIRLLNNYAIVRGDRSSFSEAIRILEQAQAIDPADRMVRDNLAKLRNMQ